eukprot:scaffold52561_cov69-Phaeocystis_antarctica.AAC.2
MVLIMLLDFVLGRQDLRDASGPGRRRVAVCVAHCVGLRPCATTDDLGHQHGADNERGDEEDGEGGDGVCHG